MSNLSLSRRRWIYTGLAAAGGSAAVAVAARIADQYGLLPPDSGGLYGPGHALTYASQRLITGHSMAREFSRGQISRAPFANGKPPKNEDYLRLQAGGFAGWRLTVSGLVSRPASFSLAQLRAMPRSSQITQLTCEEGWSFIAEWTGVPLAHVLRTAGILPQARYVAYFSQDTYWQDSLDMSDALHPQTILTYEMNGDALPLPHGGPLRMRVPRQLGYKSVKFIHRIIVADSLKKFPPGGDYSWYAGI